MNDSSPLITRRTLVHLGAATAVIAMLPLTAAPALAAASHLRRSSYAGRVGRRFTAGSLDLRLVSVSDLAGAAVDGSLAGAENAFALVFSGPLDPVLEARTHRLRAGGLGSFELFLSPIDRPGGDRRYEAVVDRSVAAR